MADCMITDAEEIARKLSYIARLNAGELRGWAAARRIDNRPPFDGENAALQARARELGVALK